MSGHCSNSQYPAFCCVQTAGSESQPLLGHHVHPHQQQRQQQQSEECHIDMHDEKSGVAPRESCPSHCKKTCKRKFWGRFCGLIFLGWVYYAFFHTSKGSRHNYHNGDDSVHVDEGQVGFGAYDDCAKHSVDWDGPSTFTTDAKHFQLRFGKGMFGQHVQIQAGPVSQPTLRIEGKISPKTGDVSENKGGIEVISHLGLNIIIKESADLFDVYMWFEDRMVIGDGVRYRACAMLDIAIIIPESYKHYGSVSIDGTVTSITAHDLQTIGFDKLDLVSTTGHVKTRGELFVDEFVLDVKTGKVEVEAIQVARVGEKALDVKVSTNTGHVAVSAKTSFVSSDVEKAHSVSVFSRTGSVSVDILPVADGAKPSNGQKYGHLDVNTRSNTGSVKNKIQLASADQELYLTSTSSTGAVDASVSDNFWGRFELETRTGSAAVREAQGSKSKISYEKQTARAKSGVKTLGGDESKVQPQIDLRASTGRVSLEFTK